MTRSTTTSLNRQFADEWAAAGYDADTLATLRDITPREAARRLGGELDCDDIEVILDRLPKVAVARLLSPKCNVSWCDGRCAWYADENDPADVARLHEGNDPTTDIDLVVMEYYPASDTRNSDPVQNRISISMPSTPRLGDYSLEEARELHAGLGRVLARAGA